MVISTVPITDEQIASFDKNGFVKIDNALTPEEVSDFRAALADVSERHRQEYTFRKGDQYTQHVNVWTVDEQVRRHVFNPKLAEMARRLSHAQRVRVWHDQWIVKMPGDRPSRWHQDLTLWPMVESGPLTCWIALVDVPVEMGCMQFIPGSHRWGRFACGTLPNGALETTDGVRLLIPEDKHDQIHPVVVPLKAGSCTFHNCLTLHYAGPNQTDQERLGFIVNYMPDRITFSGKKHVTTEALGLAEGQLLEGDLFPILASENPAEIVSA